MKQNETHWNRMTHNEKELNTIKQNETQGERMKHKERGWNRIKDIEIPWHTMINN